MDVYFRARLRVVGKLLGFFLRAFEYRSHFAMPARPTRRYHRARDRHFNYSYPRVRTSLPTRGNERPATDGEEKRKLRAAGDTADGGRGGGDPVHILYAKSSARTLA
jgi:hypothetical protein